jgi:CcmD family protein
MMSYLFAAYTLVWVVLFLYLISLSRRQRKLDQEIDNLRKMLEARK